MANIHKLIDPAGTEFGLGGAAALQAALAGIEASLADKMDKTDLGPFANYDVGVERFTGRYRGGKKIYRKIVDCGAMEPDKDKVIPHGIANMSRLIDFGGMFYLSSIAGPPFNYVYPPSPNLVSTSGQSDHVYMTLRVGAGYNGSVAITASYAYLEYTCADR